MRKVLTANSFEVEHRSFQENFILKKIHEMEDISHWIHMLAHSNVVCAVQELKIGGDKFQLCDLSKGGNMYEKIRVLTDESGPYKLDLVNWVPLEYIEMVFNATIQLVTAIEFAHSHGLIHGQLDLSRVWITQRKRLDTAEDEDNHFDAYSNLEFEITDFAPTSTMNLPLEPEAGVWPFAKGKDPEKLTKAEKMEVLKLRDIYAIGVCILEMMLGRYASLRTNIDIEHIPTEWGNLPESSTLI